MSKTPTWREFERLLALIGDLWEYVPSVRSREEFFLDRVSLLFGCRASTLFRGELLPFGSEPMRLVSVHQSGFGEKEQSLLSDYLGENGQDDPTIAPTLALAATQPLCVPRAFLRQELIPAATFYRTRHYDDFCKTVDIDFRLQVLVTLSRSRVACLSLQRAHRDPAFGERERRLAEALFGQTIRILGWPALPVGGS